MLFTKDDKRHNTVARFDDWNDFVQFVRENRNRNPRSGSSASNGDKKDYYLGDDWYGTASFDEAERLAFEGWQEGAERAAATRAGLFTKVSSLIQREEIVYDVEGMDFDVPRVLEGEPECWMRYEYHTAEGPSRKVFRWLVNLSASATISADIIERRGAAICAAIQLIEYAGHGVELWAVHAIDSCNGSGVGHAEVQIKIKAADQPVDMPRIAFALAHPSMLRRLIFGYEESLDLDMRTRMSVYPEGHGYGTPSDTVERGDVYMEKMGGWDSQWNSERSAVEWIKKSLLEAGIDLRTNAEALEPVTTPATPRQPTYYPPPRRRRNYGRRRRSY